MKTSPSRSKLLVLLLAPFLASCPASSGTLGYNSHLANVTAYRFAQTRMTPGGVSVDDPNHQVDDGALDAATAATEACLASLPALTPAQIAAGKCLAGTIPRAIDRKRFAVQIAPDWYTSRCTGQQLFPCGVDPIYCKAKPELDEVTCPCNCRSTVQDNRVVVTTPNLHLYRAELVRMISTCNYIWIQPLETCAGP